MIKNDTVLILGAGASQVYGYPLGSDLRGKIIKLSQIPFTWQSGTTGLHGFEDTAILGSDIDKISYLSFNCGFHFEDISKFHQSLSASPRNSIDAFLQDRPEFLELGKVLISMAILSCEDMAFLRQSQPSKGNWYKYLFNIIADTWENFANTRLHVITYNYDRSFETYFIHALMETFGKSLEECLHVFNTRVNIVHVHGCVADFPGFPDAKPYETALKGQYIKTAASRLKIIHEEKELTDNYEKVHALLNIASRVFILGFGYDARNLSRLKLEQYKKPMYSTRAGITNLELLNLNRLTKGRVFFSENFDADIISFFKNEATLYGDVAPHMYHTVNQAKHLGFPTFLSR